MVKIYSDAEKEKYVRGFKTCSLTLREYADKMKIEPEKLKEWLQISRYSEKFGMINLDMSSQSNVENVNISQSVTFVTDNIRIELKKGYNKDILRSIMDVILK